MLLVSTNTDVRRRESRGSELVHTGHVQPVSGTPVDVPVPRKVIFIFFVVEYTMRVCVCFLRSSLLEGCCGLGCGFGFEYTL